MAIGETMQQYIEEKKLSKLSHRQLVAGRSACQVLLTTPFFLDIASERRKAAQDPSRAAHANKQKLTGTSAYWATLLNKEKFNNINYVGENVKLYRPVANHRISVTPPDADG